MVQKCLKDFETVKQRGKSFMWAGTENWYIEPILKNIFMACTYKWKPSWNIEIKR